MRSIVRCAAPQSRDPTFEDVAMGPGSVAGARDQRYAMNIRAAEAMVSNAPKAIKILPISEV